MADVLVGSLASPTGEDGDFEEKLGKALASRDLPLIKGLLIEFAAILSTPSPNARIKLSTQLLLKHASISEVARKVANSIDDTVSRQQKEYFLRQQLAAINRELDALQRSSNSPTSESKSELDGDDNSADADDLAQLRSGIERLEKGSEERKTAVREWRKMKRIPAGSGSAELGVIRGYVSSPDLRSRS
jgi:ATP-dependent Lon protease